MTARETAEKIVVEYQSDCIRSNKLPIPLMRDIIEKYLIKERTKALREAAEITRHIEVSGFHSIEAKTLREAEKRILALIEDEKK